MTPSIFFDHFDATLPALKLGGVQFSQMQYPTLQYPLAIYPQTFTKRIINMLLTVFEDAVDFQKHPRIFSASTPRVYGLGCHTRLNDPFFAFSPGKQSCKKTKTGKICEG